MLQEIYKKYILTFPKITLFIISIFTAIMLVFALKVEIDASADSLLLEDDKDLAFFRDVSSRFETQDFLVVTYTIKDDLLSDTNIQNIQSLSEKINKLALVESINSIVNVPLLESPPKPLAELVNGAPTLLSDGVDKTLVKQEFLNSPIYKQNLVSDDFKTTALLVNLINESYSRELNHQLIVDIRNILTTFANNHNNLELHLGGVNMITDDMVEFVKSDLKVFGLLILILLFIVLYILLKQFRWVFMALFISSVSLIITSGILGLAALKITVVSSNFISLGLIMNISLIVHLIIKYKELHKINKEDSQQELVLNTLLSMIKPSFFVVITTIAGFASLVFSGILPIINFGWMMSLAISISLLVTFIIFPAILILFDKGELEDINHDDKRFTLKLANIAYRYKKSIFVLTGVLLIFSLTGANRLKVENSFIDYFKKDTEIYKGMALVDSKLGGTTPLDVIVTFKEDSSEVVEIEVDDEELDMFEDEFEEDASDKDKYFFTEAKMYKIKQIHEYLDSLEAVGKVLSLATIGDIIKRLSDGKDADSLTLALLYKELPNKYKKIILTPYIDVESNQIRISTRIIDSIENLQRDELLKKIDKDLKTMLNPKYEEFRSSNLLVMYNNMLQSLFDSQIKTIGVVVLILFLMFLVLFKSLRIALVAITVNTVPVSVIFGFMGWMNIPLDMMTITIAAISIGIAVDNTIHYIHRYRLELAKGNNKEKSMFNSHGSIGTAMFYTSTIIMIGFSMLVLSNFMPTIYFGLLTMVAMFMAIVADLLLLPVLLLVFMKDSTKTLK